MPQPCPAVSPDQTNEMRAAVGGAVRKRPITGSLEDRRLGEILASGCGRRCPGPAGRFSSSALAVKSLSGSASTNTPRMDGLEAVGRRDLHRACATAGRRAPKPSPELSRHVARLDAVGDERPVGGAAEIGPRDAVEAGRHGGQPVASSRRRLNTQIVMATSAYLSSEPCLAVLT